MRQFFTGVFLLLLLSSGVLQAQVQRCVTMERDAASRAMYPYRGSLDDFETWMQSKIASGPASSSAKAAGAVRTIPVVVHVIYSNAGENISTAQVQSQIDILNEDFRRLNPDTTATRSVFLPVAADCEIEFCLAQRDPSGNPTDGINRVYWAGSPFSDAYVDGTIKPATSWNPNQYFNIWVCNLSGGLLGWAQFPDASGLPGMPASGGAASTDGVVLLHESVGRPPHNPFPGPYNLGRTATHEVGHWLGLRHVWGDGGCSVHDFCDDTPDASAANFGCPLSANSCTETPSYPDMVENYMDYTDDDCMNIFTFDQKDRMDVVLASCPRRAVLLTSPACTPTNVVTANFTYTPSTGCAPLTVNYTSTSIGVVTSYAWSFPGGTPSTSTVANPTVVYSSAGTYSATLIVTGAVNSDTLTLTNIITASTAAPGVALPITQDFEAATWPPAGWSIDNPDAGITWQQWTVGGITPGTKAARVNCYSYAGSGQRDGLISPAMDLSGYSTVTMDFDHAYRRRPSSGTNSDSLIIYVSVCNGPWTRVLSAGEAGAGTLATATTTNTNWAPSTSSHWCFDPAAIAPCFTIDLTPYAGNQNVRVKFEVRNRNNNNLYIDNVNITGALLPPVAGFSAGDPSVCAGSTVNFTNSTTGPSTTYAWTFPGGTPGSSTATNPSVTYNTPGTYSVTLVATNAAGSDTETLTSYISVFANPAAAPTGNNASCGINNGTASANASGGSPGYTYLWNTGATSSTLSGLGAGTYTVTVTDVNGCTGTGSVTLTASGAPSASISSSSPAVCGPTGAATVAGSGGLPGYTYLWSTGATTASISGLLGGTYTVTVTDAAGCTANTSVTIATVGGATLSPGTVNDEHCGLGDGSATVNATGGTPGYSYAWSSGATTATATGLSAGTYTVTVTDGAGCPTVLTITVGSIAGPSASAGGTHITCANANDGTASVTPSGGTPGYTYLWSNGATTSSVSGLAPGTYTVTVTDAAGCTSISSFTVTEPAPLSGSSSSTAETSPGAGDGTATVTPTGGTPGYTYVWSTTPAQTTPTASGLTGGTYVVTVTDSKGCTWTDTVTVSTLVSINELLNGESIVLFPNPADDEVTLTFSLNTVQPIALKVTNSLGQTMITRDLGNLHEGSITLPASSLAEGLYFVELSTAQRRWVEKLIINR